MSVQRTPSMIYSNSLLIHTGQHSVHNISPTPILLTTLPAPLLHAAILRRTNVLVYTTTTKKRTFHLFDLKSEYKFLSVDIPGDIIGLYWVETYLLCRYRTNQLEKFIIFELHQKKLVQIASLDAAADENDIALNAVGISGVLAIAIRSTILGNVIYVPDITKSNSTRQISCHKGKIQVIALSGDGSLMATCSDKGTLIRVWNVKDENKTEPIHTFRRGTRDSEIYSLSFSHDNKFLVATSKTTTVHIFSIHSTGEDSKNSRSFFPREKKNFASYRFENVDSRPWSIAAFDKDGKIIYISEDGMIKLLDFDHEHGGDARKVFERQLYDSA